MGTKLKLKPQLWHYNEDTFEWYTILAYEYPDEKCGAIYEGYRIISLSDGFLQLLFCGAHLGEIFDDVKKAKIAAFKHWETIVRSSVYGN